MKLRHSEYVKSRLLNKDPHFRKDPQYVFFLLWQKEMREISSGVYNLLKSTRRQPMSVSALLHSVEARDEHLEANLSTMLQSVRGTKQFWYTKQSELRCMIRTFSPTYASLRSFKRWSTAMYFLLRLGGCDPASSWTAARSVRACSPLMTSTSW